MTWLILGLLIFLGVHLLPTVPQLRQVVSNRLGDAPYRGVFTVLSLIGFLLIVYGKARAPFEPIYLPPAWGPYAARALMLPAFILLVAAYAPTNIKRLVRHPMLLAVTLWALAHLLANGDLASLLLFGGFLIYAVFDAWSVTRRGVARVPRRVAWHWDMLVTLAGVLVYLLVAYFHARLFGVPVGAF